ncbi:hypothetical protein GPECTOR_140g685 [Gonium pectorale]|uniref:Uncharacterized protein n=1 Tax=Gonium pectorale TaxID=33097 RepID=A0A150FY32_GONPE|nr:hypothetical protein GPECTOR_140g685 [Gonium pectorale]|eukprot:KXZ42509.1 hypothetical protein GPECTOR_140g685 [Gonium pectorale]
MGGDAALRDEELLPTTLRFELGAKACRTRRGDERPTLMDQIRPLARELLERVVLLDKRTDFVYIPATLFEKYFTAVMGTCYDVVITLTRGLLEGNTLAVDRASIRYLFLYPLVLWGNWHHGSYKNVPGVYSVYKELLDAHIISVREPKGEDKAVFPVLHSKFVDFLLANGPDYRPYSRAMAQLARLLYLHFAIDMARRLLQQLLFDEPRLGTLVVGSPEAAALLLGPLLEMACFEAIAMEGTSKTMYVEPVKDAQGTVIEARVHGIAWWALQVRRGKLQDHHIYERSCPGSRHINRANRTAELLLLLCTPAGHKSGGWWRFLRASGVAQLFTLMLEPFWNAFLPKGAEPYRVMHVDLQTVARRVAKQTWDMAVTLDDGNPAPRLYPLSMFSLSQVARHYTALTRVGPTKGNPVALEAAFGLWERSILCGLMVDQGGHMHPPKMVLLPRLDESVRYGAQVANHVRHKALVFVIRPFVPATPEETPAERVASVPKAPLHFGRGLVKAILGVFGAKVAGMLLNWQYHFLKRMADSGLRPVLEL